MDLIDIFSIFHHQTAEYIFFFFSSAHETLSEMDHVLGRKSSLANFKNFIIILITEFTYSLKDSSDPRYLSA